MTKRIGIALLVLLSFACTPGGERDIDRSVIGPTATAGAVSISYPSTPAVLPLRASDLAMNWDAAIAEPFNASTATLSGVRVDAGSLNDAISLESFVDDGAVSVTQLAVVNESGDEDEDTAAAIVLSFLGIVVDDPEAVYGGLGFGESGGLFELSEATVRSGGLTIYRASNEDTILVGVVSTP